MIECNSIKGNKVSVSKEKLVFRPAAYAVIIKEEKILMLNTKSNNQLFFPGGGINLGETIAQGLKREVREETGLEIEVGNFLCFRESFFYYDPFDEAYQSYSFFYICQSSSAELLNDDLVEDDEAEKPRWFEVGELKKGTGLLGEMATEIIALV